MESATQIQRGLLRQLILRTRGKIFHASFIKSNGLYRSGSFRIGVAKGVKGTGTPLDPNGAVIKVFDMSRRGFRSINLDRLLSLKCGDSFHWTKGNDYSAPVTHNYILEPEMKEDELV